MKLLNGYILVKVATIKEKTDSGFFLAEGTQKLPSRGTIVAVADDITDVSVDDEVEFLRYASLDGTEEDTRICKLEHIIAIYESKS